MTKQGKNVIVVLTLLSFMYIMAGPLMAANMSPSTRLRGRILLQVESKGEAWYVNPVDGKRYFLGSPTGAVDVMRRLGLGVSERDFANFGDKAPRRLAGRILLRVESVGQAYYVEPRDLRLYYFS